MKCMNCSESVENEDGYYCNACIKSFMLIKPMPVPMIAGVSDGPMSGSNEINFNTPNRFKEMRHCIQKAAENGDFKTKRDWDNARYLWNSAEKYRDIKKVDYQVDGHAMYGGTRAEEKSND